MRSMRPPGPPQHIMSRVAQRGSTAPDVPTDHMCRLFRTCSAKRYTMTSPSGPACLSCWMYLQQQPTGASWPPRQHPRTAAMSHAAGGRILASQGRPTHPPPRHRHHGHHRQPACLRVQKDLIWASTCPNTGCGCWVETPSSASCVASSSDEMKCTKCGQGKWWGSARASEAPPTPFLNKKQTQPRARRPRSQPGPPPPTLLQLAASQVDQREHHHEQAPLGGLGWVQHIRCSRRRAGAGCACAVVVCACVWCRWVCMVAVVVAAVLGHSLLTWPQQQQQQ